MINRLFLSCTLLLANAANAISYQSVFEDSPDSQSRAFFEEAAKADRKDHLALFYLGRLAMQERDFKQAIDQFEDALDLEDNDHHYHYWYASAHIANVWNVNMLKQKGYTKRIRKALERAVELQPDHLDSLQRLLAFYALAPKSVGGNIDKARELGVVIGKLDSALGLEAKASLLAHDKKFEEAESTYAAAVETDLENIEIRYRYAAFLIQSDKFREGENQIDIALEMAIKAGDDRLARLLAYQLGKAAAVSGSSLDRGETALQAYLEEAVDGSMPGHDWARFWLARIYMHQGLSELALSSVRTVRKSTADGKLKNEISSFLKG